MPVETVRDEFKDAMRQLKKLARRRVLVGVPSNKANRDGPINNAAIGYLMENGMPEHNVPARPFLVPGVEAVLPKCLKLMQAAGAAGLAGDTARMDSALEAAGVIAEESVHKRIVSNIPPPLAPATVKARRYNRRTKSVRQDEKDYADLIAGGASPGEAQFFAGITALINSGGLNRSITHVVEKG